MRGRLRLLPRWLERVDWLRVLPEEGVRALMVFDEPGRIVLLPWETYGARITERYRELAENLDDDTGEALRLIQDRYVQSIIRKDLREGTRIYLGDAALAHLGFSIARDTKHTLYVAVFAQRIELLSPNYRNTRLTRGHSLLEDLP